GKLVPLSIALAIAATSCADPPPTVEYEVAGVVTDANSGEGIPHAAVRFVSETAYTASTQANGDGRYEMRVESDSPFGQVRAERAGWSPAEKTVYFDSPSRRIDLVLRRAATP
ncbi:MAG: hypothetical protein H5U40_14605, partial [Polyangiaceae bacterium]|nr:hypothetical protein [Polyangiaceae bacterium]